LPATFLGRDEVGQFPELVLGGVATRCGRYELTAWASKTFVAIWVFDLTPMKRGRGVCETSTCSGHARNDKEESAWLIRPLAGLWGREIRPGLTTGSGLR
jgi:hypothetical protein